MPAILGIFWLLDVLFQSLPESAYHPVFFVFLLFFCFIRVLVIGFKAPHNPKWYDLKIINLIVAEKTLFVK